MRKVFFGFLFSLYFRPFDPQYYEDEFEDEEMLDEEGRTRLKLKVCPPSSLNPFHQLEPSRLGNWTGAGTTSQLQTSQEPLVFPLHCWKTLELQAAVE